MGYARVFTGEYKRAGYFTCRSCIRTSTGRDRLSVLRLQVSEVDGKIMTSRNVSLLQQKKQMEQDMHDAGMLKLGMSFYTLRVEISVLMETKRQPQGLILKL